MPVGRPRKSTRRQTAVVHFKTATASVERPVNIVTYQVPIAPRFPLHIGYISILRRFLRAQARNILQDISKAYALVNLKLSDLQSVSYSAIAAVISLAIYQQIHLQHDTGLIDTPQ